MNRPTDHFGQLQDANPNPVGDTSEPQPNVDFDTHLQEIMMTTLSTQKTFEHPSPSRRWLPLVTAPLVGAAAAIGIVAANPFGSTEPAFAQVQAAVETASSYDSGSISIQGEFFELEEGPPGGYAFNHEYRFDGNDFELDTDPEPIDLVVIGDDVYHRGIWPENVNHVSRHILSERDEFTEHLSGIYPEASQPELILPLLQESADFELRESDDGVQTFAGSISRGVLGELTPEEVPTGLLLLSVDGEIATLPETIILEVVVTNGELSQLDIEVKGDTSRGFVDAALTSTFTEFGKPQTIVAPPSDQIVAESDYWETSDMGIGDTDIVGEPEAEIPDGEHEAAFAIMDEFQQANPALCQQEEQEMLSTEMPPPGSETAELEQFEETAIQLTKTWATCMKSHAIDPAVIEAYELIYLV